MIKKVRDGIMLRLIMFSVTHTENDTKMFLFLFNVPKIHDIISKVWDVLLD